MRNFLFEWSFHSKIMNLSWLFSFFCLPSWRIFRCPDQIWISDPDFLVRLSLEEQKDPKMEKDWRKPRVFLAHFPQYLGADIKIDLFLRISVRNFYNFRNLTEFWRGKLFLIILNSFSSLKLSKFPGNIYYFRNFYTKPNFHLETLKRLWHSKT